MAATLLVLRLHPDVTRLSWLDAAMGASSVAALAVALGAGPALAVADGGLAGVIPLSAPPSASALAMFTCAAEVGA